MFLLSFSNKFYNISYTNYLNLTDKFNFTLNLALLNSLNLWGRKNFHKEKQIHLNNNLKKITFKAKSNIVFLSHRVNPDQIKQNVNKKPKFFDIKNIEKKFTESPNILKDFKKEYTSTSKQYFKMKDDVKRHNEEKEQLNSVENMKDRSLVS